MTEEEFKAYIINHLNMRIGSFQEYEKATQSYVMLLRGKRVKVKSGKCIWNSLGAAKNALRCHLENVNYKGRYIDDEEGNRDWQATSKAQREAEDEWIANNIRFITLSEYLALQRKAKK